MKRIWERWRGECAGRDRDLCEVKRKLSESERKPKKDARKHNKVGEREEMEKECGTLRYLCGKERKERW